MIAPRPNWVPPFVEKNSTIHEHAIRRAAMLSKSTAILRRDGEGQFHPKEFQRILNNSGHSNMNFASCKCSKQETPECVSMQVLTDKKNLTIMSTMAIYKWKKGNTYKLRVWDGYMLIPIFAFSEWRLLVDRYIKNPRVSSGSSVG